MRSKIHCGRNKGSTIMNFIKGIVIGLGAIAPGLSGSVLLVIFGLYQKTITAISSTVKSVFSFARKLLKKEKNLKHSQEAKTIWENIKFLVPLIAGIGIGVILFSKFIDFLLNSFEMQTRFAFLGFILGSIPLFYKEVKKEGFSKRYYLIIAAAFLGGTFLFNFNRDLFPEVTNPNFLQSIVLGLAVAASYIVPGVDSAAILSALGLYNLWVSSLANLDLTVLVPAALGLVMGVLVVSFIINKLIAACYTLTFSFIFGLFLSVVPSVMNESCAVGMNAKTAISVAIMIVSFVLSLLFSNIEKFKEKRESKASKSK